MSPLFMARLIPGVMISKYLGGCRAQARQPDLQSLVHWQYHAQQYFFIVLFTAHLLFQN